MTYHDQNVYYENPEKNRAENWNLASPIATCSLLVERRGDCLVLEFRQKQDDQQQPPPTTFGINNIAGPIFAQAVIDCSVQTSAPSDLVDSESSTTKLPNHPPKQQQQRKIQHWIEGTIDSSRYFTLRISRGDREALIGFGFRERDQAIDLRESLQYYEASMRREYEANTMNNDDSTTSISKFTIPKLADGERIHIRTGKSGDCSKSAKSKSKPSGTLIKSDRPILLLKKPPPSSSETSIDKIASQQSSDLSNGCSVTTTTSVTTAVQSDDTGNEQAILEKEATDNYDDDNWETDFVSAS
jgi:hypothetical protein